MVIDNQKIPTFLQDFCGYAIEGHMPYANTHDIVLCIAGDAKIINALLSILKLSIPVCRTNLSAANCTWQPKVRVPNSDTLQSLQLLTQTM